MHRKQFLRMAAGLAGSAAGLSWSGWPGAVAEAAPAAPAWPPGPAPADDDAYWRLVRQQFVLEPGWTFLNPAGLGPCPLPVLNSLADAIRAEELAPSAGHDQQRWLATKTALARVLGPSCTTDQLGLVSTATEGISLVVAGLPLKSGDEVITTTHEHAALYTALLQRRQRDGIVIRTFEPDIRNGLGNVDRIAALVTPRTRLVFVSHVTCTTGQRLPAAEIAAFARPKGIWFALDGAQAPVAVPFDITACGADFYVCSTHKWIMGPKRTGFIHVRPGMLDALRPLVVGMGSYERFNVETGELVLHPTARRFEYGTQNEALFFALGTAVSFVEAIGLDRIWRHNHGLAERFLAGVRELPGVEIVSPHEVTYRTPMIAFRVRGRQVRDISEHLAKDRIRVRTVTEGGLNAIRVSFHVCNNEDDVATILASLKKLA
jgi:selenocysteine lyase/cysteine desulfurase